MPPAILNKIKTRSEKAQEEDQNKNIQDKSLTTSDILEFFEHVTGSKPTSYQKELLTDRNQFIVCRWPRQVGKTLTLCVLCLHTALTGSNRRIIILAPSFRQSRRMVRRMSTFLPRLPSWIIQGRPLKTRLDFVNNSTIEAYPNAPENVRGETCDLVLWDEGGFVQDAEDLFDATAFSITTTGGRFLVASTPGSRNHMFYQFCYEKQFEHFSRYHISYQDALEPKGPLKQHTLEQLKIQLAPDPWRWTREMEAEFAEDDETFFPMTLINSCVDPNLEYYTEEEIMSLPDLK
jgi:hypothetical protein